MKVTLSLLTAAVAVAAAQPHQHAHAHAHEKRDEVWDSTMVVVPGPTVIAYVLNGKPISEDDVNRGIADGSLVWAHGGQLQQADGASAPPAPASTAAPSSSAAAYIPWNHDSSSSAAPSPSPSSSSVYVAPTTSSSSVYVAPSTSSSAPASSYSAPASSSSAAPSSAPSSAPSYSGGNSGSSGSSSGVDSPFPDGQLDCSTFPSSYGAVPVDWMGLGGWTGVQSPGSHSSAGMSNIMTLVKSQCPDGNCCTEGSYCSYACPAGYQKSQWPTTQGATGQSVGGIQCLNGKLHLTNQGLSKNLCMTGASQVTVLVQNKMSSNAAICRTDYPGTEAETIPLDTQPGSTNNLTCPDADNYYNWEGGHTSAQYYVNPKGVSASNACQWGSSANPWGNYAPLNLGVGYSNGAAWLAIFQNAPTTTASLDFTVTITGDNVSGNCKYSNGQYCSGPNYSQCSSTTGCTVSISSGTATYVFSDS
ncbi:Beta-glucosidase (SUN) [Recurvomyces mirabilis]|nr:Beta-glucosidase (SUN) [Recurvomyces mirabilis]